ncbi:perlucin-like protein [Penaeus chinensis]|uniref:perlucin-like protein n=1 Tax=Penaeus chinensis TaxID=139456 RepID=UPI001FB80213|nr:perlucin-like protein [Penaeus chinensis]
MKLLLTLLATCATFSAAQVVNPCPTGYEVFWMDSATPVCLNFAMYGKGTWSELRQMCQAQGADLAKLEGNLHYQVVQYINQHPALMDEAFWIGGTDAASEGNWVWVIDNTPMDTQSPPWYPGQPNHGTAANCACLSTPDFMFHSCDNDRKMYAICQI